MIIRSLAHGWFYKSIAVILSIALTLSSVSPMGWGMVVGAGAHAAASLVSTLPGDANSPLTQALQNALSPEPAEQLTDMGALGPDGQPVGMLMDIGALQADVERKPAALANPISVSRVQSAYRAADAVSGTLVITFTVTNNQPPVITPPRLPPSATITDTLQAVSAIDFSKDPNVIRNVLLVDSLTGYATFVSSSPVPDHKASQYVWNLGDIPPMGRVTATLKISVPTNIMDFIDLDMGATAWGTLQGRDISISTAPARLAPDAIGGEPTGDWLKWTVDADYYDEYMTAKAAELGNDWQQMFAYVRSLGYESYKGSLRGTRGTLWSEAGNSLDQTSLLIAMLRGSGIPSRYRHGTLLTARAQELILSMFPEPTRVIGHIPPGVEVADPANAPQLLAETVDHWWVEAYLPGLGWTDLDPCFTAASPGQTFVESVASDGTDRIAEISDMLRHKIVIKAEVENYHPLNVASQGLERQIVLTVTLRTVEIVGEPVTFGHIVNTTGQSGAIFYAVQYSYLPYLRIGDFERGRIVQGKVFQDLISNYPFGTWLTTGEWLVFEIIDPDGRIERHTREIVDLIGHEARQAGGVVRVGSSRGTEPLFSDFDEHAMLFSIGQLSEDSVANDFARWQKLLRQVRQVAAGTPMPDWERQNVLIHGMVVSLECLSKLFYLASDFTADYMAPSAFIKSYEDSPRILIVSSRLRAENQASPITITMDLLRNTRRVIAFPGQSRQAALTFNVVRGMMDTFLESIVPEQLGIQPGISMKSISEAMQQQGITSHLLTSADLDALSSLGISPEAKSRITSALQGGKVVIVPGRMVTVGTIITIAWWEIDPTDGATISVMENGLHPNTIELRLLMNRFVSKGGHGPAFLGGVINMFLGTMAFLVEMPQGWLSGACIPISLLGGGNVCKPVLVWTMLTAIAKAYQLAMSLTYIPATCKSGFFNVYSNGAGSTLHTLF